MVVVVCPLSPPRTDYWVPEHTVWYTSKYTSSDISIFPNFSKIQTEFVTILWNFMFYFSFSKGKNWKNSFFLLGLAKNSFITFQDWQCCQTYMDAGQLGVK